MSPAIQRAISADGTEIAYRVFGTGEHVLFVHGSATLSTDWAFLLPHLRPHFSVVTMDRRGRGKSGDSDLYEMALEAEDICAVAKATGADLLVAHSYGALCSVLATKHMEALRRLVIYEPPISVKDEGIDELNALVDQGLVDLALERFLSYVGTSPEQLALIRGSRAWPVLLDAVPPLPRELRAAAAWKNPAGPIEVPTLYLKGSETRSPAYLDGLDDLLSAFADAERRDLEGQLHLAHVFDAENFAAEITEFCR